MKNTIKLFLRNDLTTMLLRLLLAYGVLWALRIMFYVYNYDVLGAIEWAEIPNILKGAMLFDSANVAYTLGLFIVLSLIPLRRRAKTWYRAVVMGAYVLAVSAFVFFNSCDTVYFHYARKRATIDEFQYADNSNTGSVMLKATLENWHILTVGLVILALSIWLYTRVRYYPTKIRSRAGYYVVSGAIFVAAVFMLVVMARGGVGRAIRPISLSNAAHYSASPQKANALLGNPFCILRTMGNKSLRYTEYFKPQQLDSIFSPIHTPIQGGEAKPQKNVVLFIMESLSNENSLYLNPDIYAGTDDDFMPFMDSLMQQGLVMRQAYANGAKSIDALPSILASIPSFKTPFATMPQSLNPMQGLGGTLGEMGYQSWFFNGSEESSMGFVAFAKLAGFTNIRTRENYEASCGKNDFDNYWGIWDEPFMQYIARELNTAKEPFIATTFTLSNHHPFVVPKEYEGKLPKGHTKAHQTVAYTDRAVREFMTYAKAQSWYENTIFLFIADHVSSEIYAPKTRTVTGNSHIIYFLYTPDGSLRGVNDRVTCQVDVMPTLLGILGYQKPYFAFGRDALAEIKGDSTALPSTVSGSKGSKGSTSKQSLPCAVNYRSGMYQIITDNYAYFFDEQNLTGAYAMQGDTMQQNNTLGQNPEQERAAQNMIQAIIQSYYKHVEAGDYMPK